MVTVAPNLLLLTSMSSNSPEKSSSLSAPFAEFSILLKIFSNFSFKSSLWFLASLHTLLNNSEGNMKNPFSLTKSSLTDSASLSEIKA